MASSISYSESNKKICINSCSLSDFSQSILHRLPFAVSMIWKGFLNEADLNVLWQVNRYERMNFNDFTIHQILSKIDKEGLASADVTVLLQDFTQYKVSGEILNQISSVIVSRVVKFSEPLSDKKFYLFLKKYPNITDITLWKGGTDVSLVRVVQQCKKIVGFSIPRGNIGLLGFLALSTSGLNLQRISFSDHERIEDSTISLLFSTKESLKKMEEFKPGILSKLAKIGCLRPTPRAFQYIDLSGCSKLTDKTMKIISCANKTLREVSLARCPQITDAGCNFFSVGGLPKLTGIWLDCCKRITSVGVHSIVKASPMIRTISLSECDELDDSGLRLISGERRDWAQIDLADCPLLTSKGLEEFFFQIRTLRALCLDGCEGVSDSVLTVLAKVEEKMVRISLRECPITINGVNILLGGCKKLKKIDLSGCAYINFNDVEWLRHEYPNVKIDWEPQDEEI